MIGDTDELMRILLVEDDPKDVNLTLTALGHHHMANEVVVARDGAEALDFLHRRGRFQLRQKGNPVVVMLDLKLPKIDGIEVLRAMKESEELRLIPVVILTSSREERDLQTCYELGVNAYVVKPVQFHQFVEAIRELGMFWALVNQPPPGSVATEG